MQGPSLRMRKNPLQSWGAKVHRPPRERELSERPPDPTALLELADQSCSVLCYALSLELELKLPNNCIVSIVEYAASFGRVRRFAPIHTQIRRVVSFLSFFISHFCTILLSALECSFGEAETEARTVSLRECVTFADCAV